MRSASSGVILSAVLISLGGCSSRLNLPAQAVEKPTQVAAKLVRHEYEQGEITRLCQKAIADAESELTAITSLPESERNIETTVLRFENAMAELSDVTTPLTFMGYVSRADDLRNEGSQCEEKMGSFGVEVFTRRNLYEALKSATPRSAGEARLMSITLNHFESNGLRLSDEKLAEVKPLLTQLSVKETQFSTNLNNEVSTVAFTPAELAGVPEDAMARFKSNAAGQLVVTTKSTDYVAVIENATLPETRHRMQLAYYNRAAEANTKLLQEAVALRADIAKKMGYANWSDFRTSAGRMAKSSGEIRTFLNGLKGKLAERNQQELAQLLAFKKELDPTADHLDPWDTGFLSYQLKKRDFQVDDEVIREYFPSDVVVKGVFQVYSQMLGVSFVEVQNASVWDPSVKLYEIHNAKDGRLIAYFYADLAPRPGKYGHAAAFTLISGREVADGVYNLPISAMVANLNPPGVDKPSLLSHDDVTTFFHEFGHIMHQTLTRVPYASLSGASVAWDFVEAPSQMLENWGWSPQVLALVSSHYKTGEKLPADLFKRMLASRDFGQGMLYTRQLLLGLFDLELHTGVGQADVTETYNQLYREIVGQEPIAGGHFPASFGHLMGGYDSGYYGYLWSDVYAQDMFTLFPSDNLMDPVVGGRYRRTILERGNMQDALELLVDFLGRKPDPSAFFRKLHI